MLCWHVLNFSPPVYGECADCDRQRSQEWSSRDIPTIDWERLPGRVREIVPWLETCLESRSLPIFRKQYIWHTLHLPVKRWKLDTERLVIGAGYFGDRELGSCMSQTAFSYPKI